MTLTDTQKRELLAQHFLLRHLSAADMARLANRAEVWKFGADDRIFLRGDAASHTMVVIRGKVQISSPSEDGDKIVFAVMHPGDVFGEIALLDGHERSTDAVATEDVEVLALQRDDFIKVLERNPKLCIDLLRVMCTRIRHTNELLEDFSVVDLRRRMAKRVRYLTENSSPGVDGLKMSVRVSRDELIAMMGVSPEAITRQLLFWDRQGIVKLDQGWITIQNPSALNEIAAEDF